MAPHHAGVMVATPRPRNDTREFRVRNGGRARCPHRAARVMRRAPGSCGMSVHPLRAQYPPRVRNGKYHTLRVLRGASPCAHIACRGSRPAQGAASGHPHPRQSRGTIPHHGTRSVNAPCPVAVPPRTGEFRTMPSRAPRWRAATGNGAATPAVPSGSHQKPARARSRALTEQVDFAILPRICNHRSPYGLQGLVKNGSHFSVLQSWRFFCSFSRHD